MRSAWRAAAAARQTASTAKTGQAQLPALLRRAQHPYPRFRAVALGHIDFIAERAGPAVPPASPADRGMPFAPRRLPRSADRSGVSGCRGSEPSEGRRPPAVLLVLVEIAASQPPYELGFTLV